VELCAIESARWRDVPAEVRLRRALKLLARCYGLRVERIETGGGS